MLILFGLVITSDKFIDILFKVLGQTYYIEIFDFEHSINEDRYIAIGKVGEVLLVVGDEDPVYADGGVAGDRGGDCGQCGAGEDDGVTPCSPAALQA